MRSPTFSPVKAITVFSLKLCSPETLNDLIVYFLFPCSGNC